MKILYIHGFGSSTNSTKADILIDYFGKESIIHPTIEIEPYKAIKQLTDILFTNIINLIIGSSLGGFYALNLVNRNDIPTICINPSLTPFKTLTIGKYNNFHTNETFNWTIEYNNQLKELYNKNIVDNHTESYLLNFHISTDDERLPTLKNDIKRHYEYHNSLIEYDNCGHRFSRFDDVIPHIKEIINQLKKLPPNWTDNPV